MIPINVSMDGNVSKFRYGYLDSNGKLVTLCRNCKEYGFSKLKRKPFDDGFHNLTLLAIFDTGSVSAQVQFTVDTKDPKIKKTLPTKKTGNGHFEVKFQEANPQILTLFIEDEIIPVDIEENCKTKNQLDYQCAFDIDLTELEGEEVSYLFTLTDIVGRTDISKERRFTVEI